MKLIPALRRTLVMLLALAIICSSTIIATGAEEKQSDFTVTKISNPDNNYRMVDGLVEGGDRETSYAWCMADRGDYLYIGTNKNVVGQVVDSLSLALKASGLDADAVWTLADALTNGEIPRPQSNDGGYILRVNKTTGETVKLYSAPPNVSFRMAITHGDNVYFGSYAADAVSNNDIIRIDKNDNLETVYTTTNGTSMRAACILDGKLYFGGVDESEVLLEGDEACKKLAILQKDEEDDSVWHRIADYKDFDKRYTTDPGVQGSVSSPIWDICAYNGAIYATVPNSSGFAMFKGVPAEEDEEANEYGWRWEEVIGFFNGVNNIGLCDDPAGYTGIHYGMLSTTGTPFVFNDELYVMDFDSTIMSELYAIQGLMGQIMTNTGKPSEYLAFMYETMRHPQSVWKLDDETGVFNKVEGFSQVADNPCTEYLWRTDIYDGELYLGTMDSATIYNYVTRLTNGSFARMTKEEWKDQLMYIKELIKLFAGNAEDEQLPEDILEDAEDLAQTAAQMMDELDTMDLNADSAEKYIDRYICFGEKIRLLISKMKEKLLCCNPAAQLINKLEALKAKLTELYENIDWKGLAMYAYISHAVKKDKWGFELYKTADGENFEPVTIDGFGNKYNYGARTLLGTDDGLYIGTANPFYGAQLYRLTNNNAEGTVVLGDADGDGEVTAFDVTFMQRYLAWMDTPADFDEQAADVDGDGEVTALDVTFIQRWLALMDVPYPIGE